MRMVILGALGKMGLKLIEKYRNDYEIIGIDLNESDIIPIKKSIDEIDDFDIAIDFSSINAKTELIKILKRNKPTISGTTGYTKEEIEYFYSLNKDQFYWSCNFSKGIALFEEISKIIKKEYPIFDFVEIHSIGKKDAPSGTAKYLADILDYPYNKIQCLRLPLAPAIHEIVYTTDNERIIIRHEAINKNAFIEGIDRIIKELI